MGKYSVKSHKYYVFDLVEEGEYSHILKRNVEREDCIEIPSEVVREYNSVRALLVQLNINIQNIIKKDTNYIRSTESRRDLYRYHLEYLINVLK